MFEENKTLQSKIKNLKNRFELKKKSPKIQTYSSLHYSSLTTTLALQAQLNPIKIENFPNITSFSEESQSTLGMARTLYWHHPFWLATTVYERENSRGVCKLCAYRKAKLSPMKLQQLQQ